MAYFHNDCLNKLVRGITLFHVTSVIKGKKKKKKKIQIPASPLLIGVSERPLLAQPRVLRDHSHGRLQGAPEHREQNRKRAQKTTESLSGLH